MVKGFIDQNNKFLLDIVQSIVVSEGIGTSICPGYQRARFGVRSWGRASGAASWSRATIMQPVPQCDSDASDVGRVSVPLLYHCP
jgi:hypothetical protein